jgi:hypothetical protein
MSRTSRLISFLLVAASAFSQQATVSVTKDPAAIAVAQQTILAMGGTALSGYQDSTANGTMTFYSDTGTVNVPVILKSKGTTELRQELQRGQSTDIYVSNGATACMNSAKIGQIAMFSIDLNSQRIDHVPALSLLSEYANGNMNLQYAGTDTVNGSQANVIALSFSIPGLPSGYDSLQLTQHLFFVDSATGMVAKIQSVRNGNGPSEMTAKIEMYFSNYQNVNGIAVPFKRSQYVDGRLVSDLALTSIAFNTGLIDTEFVPACGGGQ